MLTPNDEGAENVTRQAPTPIRSDNPSTPDIRAVRDKTRAIKRLDLDPSGEARASGPDVTEDEIRAAAYNRYLARGGEDGLADDDWFTAEQELRASRQR